eukprot:Sspe_Gene.99944::Locus_74151_Transcript_1_1_Confidence_1.000_Length_3300::g.99944::m.99944
MSERKSSSTSSYQAPRDFTDTDHEDDPEETEDDPKRHGVPEPVTMSSMFSIVKDVEIYQSDLTDRIAAFNRDFGIRFKIRNQLTTQCLQNGHIGRIVDIIRRWLQQVTRSKTFILHCTRKYVRSMKKVRHFLIRVVKMRRAYICDLLSYWTTTEEELRKQAKFKVQDLQNRGRFNEARMATEEYQLYFMSDEVKRAAAYSIYLDRRRQFRKRLLDWQDEYDLKQQRLDALRNEIRKLVNAKWSLAEDDDGDDDVELRKQLLTLDELDLKVFLSKRPRFHWVPGQTIKMPEMVRVAQEEARKSEERARQMGASREDAYGMSVSWKRASVSLSVKSSDKLRPAFWFGSRPSTADLPGRKGVLTLPYNQEAEERLVSLSTRRTLEPYLTRKLSQSPSLSPSPSPPLLCQPVSREGTRVSFKDDIVSGSPLSVSSKASFSWTHSDDFFENTSAADTEDAEQCVKLTRPKKGSFGLSFCGYTVTEVAEGSPAEEAGIVPGIRILSVGGKDVGDDTDEIERAFASMGRSGVLRYMRPPTKLPAVEVAYPSTANSWLEKRSKKASFVSSAVRKGASPRTSVCELSVTISIIPVSEPPFDPCILAALVVIVIASSSPSPPPPPDPDPDPVGLQSTLLITPDRLHHPSQYVPVMSCPFNTDIAPSRPAINAAPNVRQGELVGLAVPPWPEDCRGSPIELAKRVQSVTAQFGVGNQPANPYRVDLHRPLHRKKAILSEVTGVAFLAGLVVLTLAVVTRRKKIPRALPTKMTLKSIVLRKTGKAVLRHVVELVDLLALASGKGATDVDTPDLQTFASMGQRVMWTPAMTKVPRAVVALGRGVVHQPKEGSSSDANSLPSNISDDDSAPPSLPASPMAQLRSPHMLEGTPEPSHSPEVPVTRERPRTRGDDGSGQEEAPPDTSPPSPTVSPKRRRVGAEPSPFASAQVAKLRFHPPSGRRRRRPPVSLLSPQQRAQEALAASPKTFRPTEVVAALAVLQDIAGSATKPAADTSTAATTSAAPPAALWKARWVGHENSEPDRPPACALRASFTNSALRKLYETKYPF